MANRLMFYCQHLVGIGHLVRSAELVRYLSPEWSVLFVCGGPIPDSFVFPQNAEILRLPPIRSDAEYVNLQTCDSALSIDMVQALRSAQLLESFVEFEPDVVVTELFPFGRRQFSFELIPLLEAAHKAHPRPLVAASVRDILVTKKNQQRHEEWVCSVVDHYYNLVLVHSDPAIQLLNETFSRVEDLNCPVEYTGYVVPPEKDSQLGAPAGMSSLAEGPYILVSVGSGQLQAGEDLIAGILRAAPLLERTTPCRLVICAGPAVSYEKYEQYVNQAANMSNVTLLHHSDRMKWLLNHATLSISLAGYNTTMEILAAGVPALMYPAEPNGDQEQIRRARKLAESGIVRLLEKEELQPALLARVISDSIQSKTATLSIDTSGAETSAKLLRNYFLSYMARPAAPVSFPSLQTAPIPKRHLHDTKRKKVSNGEITCG